MRGFHQSVQEHAPFLWGKFYSMVEKRKWSGIPYHVACHIPDLRLIPPGVKVERYWHPLFLGNYFFNTNNSNTLPLALLSTMQYGK